MPGVSAWCPVVSVWRPMGFQCGCPWGFSVVARGLRGGSHGDSAWFPGGCQEFQRGFQGLQCGFQDGALFILHPLNYCQCAVQGLQCGFPGAIGPPPGLRGDTNRSDNDRRLAEPPDTILMRPSDTIRSLQRSSRRSPPSDAILSDNDCEECRRAEWGQTSI